MSNQFSKFANQQQNIQGVRNLIFAPPETYTSPLAIFLSKIAAGMAAGQMQHSLDNETAAYQKKRNATLRQMDSLVTNGEQTAPTVRPPQPSDPAELKNVANEDVGYTNVMGSPLTTRARAGSVPFAPLSFDVRQRLPVPGDEGQHDKARLLAFVDSPDPVIARKAHVLYNNILRNEKQVQAQKYAQEKQVQAQKDALERIRTSEDLRAHSNRVMENLRARNALNVGLGLARAKVALDPKNRTNTFFPVPSQEFLGLGSEGVPLGGDIYKGLTMGEALPIRKKATERYAKEVKDTILPSVDAEDANLISLDRFQKILHKYPNESFMPFTRAHEELENISHHLALSNRNLIPGILSDSDINMLHKIVPNTRYFFGEKGNERTIAAMIAKSKRVKAYAKFIKAYFKQNNIDEGALDAWNRYTTDIPMAQITENGDVIPNTITWREYFKKISGRKKEYREFKENYYKRNHTYHGSEAEWKKYTTDIPAFFVGKDGRLVVTQGITWRNYFSLEKSRAKHHE